MPEPDLSRTILIVVGASLRGEEMDRPLGYRIAEEITKRLPADSGWRAVVISDILYLNDKDLADCPVVSLGGPGVNSLSAVLFRELPSVLAIDETLLIQMDADLEDRRCCLWGMDHDQTVEAVDLFIKLHLDHYVRGVTGHTADS
jgi:hypothetical protein